MDATLHIRLHKDLKEELEGIGDELDIKLSNVIRMALEEFAENHIAPTTTKINLDRL
jgi:antitoxin component of RelBE/YafQ-DinJ toxin-antitoxin module